MGLRRKGRGGGTLNRDHIIDENFVVVFFFFLTYIHIYIYIYIPLQGFLRPSTGFRQSESIPLKGFALVAPYPSVRSENQ